MKSLILDISTAALDNAAGLLTEPAADRNLKDPVKIAANIAEKKADQLEKAGMDPDLCRITGIGWWHVRGILRVELCQTEDQEREQLEAIAAMLNPTDRPVMIGFNSLAFDWPILNRRARYLGVKGLDINCDRYKSPHLDLFAKLSTFDRKAHSLGFYVKRLGWDDLKKSLSGAEEARVPVSGKWDELRDSLNHDVEATRRLAVWMGLLA